MKTRASAGGSDGKESDDGAEILATLLPSEIFKGYVSEWRTVTEEISVLLAEIEI